MSSPCSTQVDHMTRVNFADIFVVSPCSDGDTMHNPSSGTTSRTCGCHRETPDLTLAQQSTWRRSGCAARELGPSIRLSTSHGSLRPCRGDWLRVGHDRRPPSRHSRRRPQRSWHRSSRRHPPPRHSRRRPPSRHSRRNSQAERSRALHHPRMPHRYGRFSLWVSNVQRRLGEAQRHDFLPAHEKPRPEANELIECKYYGWA